MHGIYAKNLATAEGIRTELAEAGIAVLAVREVDLLDEGASLVPKKAVLVEMAEQDVPRAVQALEERAPQLLEWVEDLSHLSPIPHELKGEAPEEATAPPSVARAAWEKDPAAWTSDLFSEDEELPNAVLAWIEASTVPTAEQIGKALERAIREDREDLIWPLCRLLKSVLEDRVLRPVQALFYVPPTERAPGIYSAIDRLVELAWDPSSSVRRNFCLAAGQISSEPLLAPLVSLLDDPEEVVRYEAIGALFGMVHQDFDYDSEGPLEERAIAVARWKEWLARRLGGGPWSS